VPRVRAFEEAFHRYMESNQPEVLKEIETKKEISEDLGEKLKKAIAQCKESVPY